MSFDVCDDKDCPACNLKRAVHAMHEETGGDVGTTLACLFAALEEVADVEIHSLELGIGEPKEEGTVH